MNPTEKLTESRGFTIFLFGCLIGGALHFYGPPLLKDLYVPNIIFYLTTIAAAATILKRKKTRRGTIGTSRTVATTHRRRISRSKALKIVIFIALAVIIGAPIFIDHILPILTSMLT